MSHWDRHLKAVPRALGSVAWGKDSNVEPLICPVGTQEGGKTSGDLEVRAWSLEKTWTGQQSKLSNHPACLGLKVSWDTKLSVLKLRN